MKDAQSFIKGERTVKNTCFKQSLFSLRLYNFPVRRLDFLLSLS